MKQYTLFKKNKLTLHTNWSINILENNKKQKTGGCNGRKEKRVEEQKV